MGYLFFMEYLEQRVDSRTEGVSLELVRITPLDHHLEGDTDIKKGKKYRNAAN